MVRIHDLLYVDEEIRDRRKEVNKAVSENRILHGVYYIALASNKNEQLDIFSEYMFYKERKRRDDIVIVGIANGKKSAYELVKNMAEDAYRETGTCDLRALFD